MEVKTKLNNNNESELIKLHFENMLVKWGASQPLRTGLHASSVLVSDADWCVREHVLAELFSDEARKPEMHPWDWKREAIFENGWDLHKRHQRILAKFGKVVWSPVSDEQASEITHNLPPALFKYYVKLVDGDQWFAAELDLTHYDETRNMYSSPDAILQFGPERYIVEIKGINHDEFTGYPELYEREFHNGAYRYSLYKEARKGVKDCTLEDAMKASQTVNKAFYQANLYMHLLNIKKAILLIENKNNQDFKVWVIQYDKEASVEYVQRIYKVKGAVINARVHGQFPQRICKSRGDERARRCPMRDCCFSEKMEG